MQRIYNQDADRKEVALKTLAWVSYVFRSLSLRKIQHAVAIRPGDTDLDKEFVMEGSSMSAVCAGLIIVDQRTSMVTLVHYTAKHYSEQIRSVSFPNFHASITMSCATYLTLGRAQRCQYLADSSKFSSSRLCRSVHGGIRTPKPRRHLGTLNFRDYMSSPVAPREAKTTTCSLRQSRHDQLRLLLLQRCSVFIPRLCHI